MPAIVDAVRTIEAAVTHHTRLVQGSIGGQLADPPAPAAPLPTAPPSSVHQNGRL